MTEKKEKKTSNRLCACGCGQSISNAKIKLGARFKNRAHWIRSKRVNVKPKKALNPRPKTKLLAKGYGIPALLKKCYKLGLSKKNSELWIRDKNNLESYWEVHSL